MWFVALLLIIGADDELTDLQLHRNTAFFSFAAQASSNKETAACNMQAYASSKALSLKAIADFRINAVAGFSAGLVCPLIPDEQIGLVARLHFKIFQVCLADSVLPLSDELSFSTVYRFLHDLRKRGS